MTDVLQKRNEAAQPVVDAEGDAAPVTSTRRPVRPEDLMEAYGLIFGSDGFAEPDEAETRGSPAPAPPEPPTTEATALPDPVVASEPAASELAAAEPAAAEPAAADASARSDPPLVARSTPPAISTPIGSNPPPALSTTPPGEALEAAPRPSQIPRPEGIRKLRSSTAPAAAETPSPQATGGAASPGALQLRQTLRWDPSQHPLGASGPASGPQSTEDATAGRSEPGSTRRDQVPSSAPQGAGAAASGSVPSRRDFGATALGLGPISVAPLAGDTRRRLELSAPESSDDVPWNSGQASRTKKRAAMAALALVAVGGLVVLVNQGEAPAPDSDLLKKAMTETAAAPLKDLPTPKTTEPAKAPPSEPAAEQRSPEPAAPDAREKLDALPEADPEAPVAGDASARSRSAAAEAKAEKAKRRSRGVSARSPAAAKAKPPKPAAEPQAAAQKKPKVEATATKAPVTKAGADDPLGRRK